MSAFAALWMLLAASPSPSPNIGPADVIRILLDALEHSNSPLPNAGIYTAYQFASPANRKITAPYGRFLRAVKAPAFAALREPHETQFGALKFEGDQARQIVRVRTRDGRITTFLFQVSRQTEGLCVGCWMTDGVVPSNDSD